METKKLFDDEVRRLRASNGLIDLVDEAHDNAVAHGFYDGIASIVKSLPGDRLVDEARMNFVLAQIGKICSEAGEAVSVIQKQGLRSGDLLEELADVVIRTLDLAGYLGHASNFSQILLWKMEKNRVRPRLHGGLC